MAEAVRELGKLLVRGYGQGDTRHPAHDVMWIIVLFQLRC
jgi:hypothetical protein